MLPSLDNTRMHSATALVASLHSRAVSVDEHGLFGGQIVY
jgi:hypothetical protein